MEQLVTELKKILPFKETTMVGDIVLIAAKTPQMLVFARVGDIERDQTRKEEWWHVTLHMLSIPIQTVVWTLRMPQFTGQETFTMGGEGRFIKAVRFDGPSQTPLDPSGPERKAKEGGRRQGLRVIK